MRIGKTTVGPAVCCLLALTLQPSAVLADIPPPPKALHRIGFEIFKKHTSSTNAAAAKDVGGGADGLTQEQVCNADGKIIQ